MRIVVSPAYLPQHAYLAQLPSRMDQGEGAVLHDGRNRVVAFEHEGVRYVVKRFRRANLAQQVAYTFFRPSKARRAYAYAARLRALGIDTPREVAYMERQRCGLFTVGYFVSEECTWPSAIDPLVRAEQFDKPLALAVAALLVQMHSQGVLHGDINLSNILYHPAASGSYAFALIDTNRSRFTQGWPSDEACLHNLTRLTHRRDLLQFIAQEYARRRGWDPEQTAQTLQEDVKDFERRIERKKKWERRLGLKK